MTKRAKLLTTQDGDWEALFIDGKLIDQDEQLGEGNQAKFWIGIAHEHNLAPDDLESKELNDEDDHNCNYDGGLDVSELWELDGKY